MPQFQLYIFYHGFWAEQDLRMCFAHASNCLVSRRSHNISTIYPLVSSTHKTWGMIKTQNPALCFEKRGFNNPFMAQPLQKSGILVVNLLTMPYSNMIIFVLLIPWKVKGLIPLITIWKDVCLPKSADTHLQEEAERLYLPLIHNFFDWNSSENYRSN